MGQKYGSPVPSRLELGFEQHSQQNQSFFPIQLLSTTSHTVQEVNLALEIHGNVRDAPLHSEAR